MCRHIIYRVLYLKRIPNYYTHEPLNTENDETNENTALLQQCPVVAADASPLNRHGRDFTCSVALCALVTDTTCVQKQCHQLVYCRLIRYLLLTISIAKCKNSSERFRE
jgi:hypothetical protein